MKSSIEFLYIKMYEHRGNITIEEFEQCKQMHKQEIEDAYSNGRVDEQFKGTSASFYITKAEQYYKNTYEKE